MHPRHTGFHGYPPGFPSRCQPACDRTRHHQPGDKQNRFFHMRRPAAQIQTHRMNEKRRTSRRRRKKEDTRKQISNHNRSVTGVPACLPACQPTYLAYKSRVASQPGNTDGNICRRSTGSLFKGGRIGQGKASHRGHKIDEHLAEADNEVGAGLASVVLCGGRCSGMSCTRPQGQGAHTIDISVIKKIVLGQGQPASTAGRLVELPLLHWEKLFKVQQPEKKKFQKRRAQHSLWCSTPAQCAEDGRADGRNPRQAQAGRQASKQATEVGKKKRTKKTNRESKERKKGHARQKEGKEEEKHKTRSSQSVINQSKWPHLDIVPGSPLCQIPYSTRQNLKQKFDYEQPRRRRGRRAIAACRLWKSGERWFEGKEKCLRATACQHGGAVS